MNKQGLAWLAAVAAAWGSGLAAYGQEGEAPPIVQITSLEISRLTTAGYLAYVPWDPARELAREGDLIRVTYNVYDADLPDEDIYVRKTTQWIPYDNYWAPEVGPVEGDSRDYQAMRVTGSGEDFLTGQYEFPVPEFAGPNQARLRGLIDYDVELVVTIWASNDEEPGEESVVTVDRFDFRAVENTALRPGNPPPFADAGGDQTVAAGTTVILDGSHSYDGFNVGFDPLDPNVFEKDLLNYTWEWISGPERVDPEPDPDAPSYLQPGQWPLALVTLDVPGTYVYRLLVDDGVNATPSTDSVTITVLPAIAENRAPRAVISGPSEPVVVGSVVELSGEQSSDPDGDQLSFYWRQTNEVGGALTPDEVMTKFQPLHGLTSSKVSWKAVQPGTYYFTLLVTDPGGLSDRTPVFKVEVVAASTAGDVATRTSDADQPVTGNAGSRPTAPAGCGNGVLPLAVVPPVLWLGRRRTR